MADSSITTDDTILMPVRNPTNFFLDIEHEAKTMKLSDQQDETTTSTPKKNKRPSTTTFPNNKDRKYSEKTLMKFNISPFLPCHLAMLKSLCCFHHKEAITSQQTHYGTNGTKSNHNHNNDGGTTQPMTTQNVEEEEIWETVLAFIQNRQKIVQAMKQSHHLHNIFREAKNLLSSKDETTNLLPCIYSFETGPSITINDNDNHDHNHNNSKSSINSKTEKENGMHDNNYKIQHTYDNVTDSSRKRRYYQMDRYYKETPNKFRNNLLSPHLISSNSVSMSPMNFVAPSSMMIKSSDLLSGSINDGNIALTGGPNSMALVSRLIAKKCKNQDQTSEKLMKPYLSLLKAVKKRVDELSIILKTTKSKKGKTDIISQSEEMFKHECSHYEIYCKLQLWKLLLLSLEDVNYFNPKCFGD